MTTEWIPSRLQERDSNSTADQTLVNDDLLDVTDQAISISRKARPYVDMVCSVFYLQEHAEHRFHRFATEDELARAAIFDIRQAPPNGPVWHRVPLSLEVS